MDFIKLFIMLSILFGFIFLTLKIKAPQTIWLGMTFLSFILYTGLVLGIFLLQKDWRMPLVFLIILLLISIIIAPFLIITTFIVNGVKLLRNEGVRISNLLPLLFGMSIILYVCIWPMAVDITQRHILNTLYLWVIFTGSYLSILLIVYALSNWLNLIHFNKEKIDYFIVLGAGLIGKEVTPLLAGRINKGLEIRNIQGSGKLVFSGGQGPDELIPEGDAMAQYALYQGVPHEYVLKETESTNTQENIDFSKQIIEEDWSKESTPNIAIVTNNYHVLRGLMLAKDQGMNCIGYGSKSKFYFSLNAFLREFAAYLQMTFKVHLSVIGLTGFVLWVQFIF